jgi:hypothetical protein
VSCHGQELLITENCVAALRRIRSKVRKCILWIDSICIDQSSIEERNHQVALMGDVYSMASEVIIWLVKKLPVPTLQCHFSLVITGFRRRLYRNSFEVIYYVNRLEDLKVITSLICFVVLVG